MKYVLAAVATLALGGCNGTGIILAPSAAVPASPPPVPGYVSVLVFAAGSHEPCLVGATVEIVRGYGIGQIARQPEGCDFWSPGASTATLRELVANTEVTLRVAADGYSPAELTVTVMPGQAWYQPYTIELAPNR